MQDKSTDVSGEDEEIIVGQGTMLVRVQKGFDIQAIHYFVFILQNLQSLCVVQEGLLALEKMSGGLVGMSIGQSHDEKLARGQRWILWGIQRKRVVYVI